MTKTRARLYALLLFGLIAADLSASDESGCYTKKLLPPSTGIYKENSISTLANLSICNHCN
ncbi:MAG: hypothetical protein PHW04_15620 [Candidatus Wallbacteria bacterium]|nr:hypothetical protein [Candidatus Wallbacteria bacterium]